MIDNFQPGEVGRLNQQLLSRGWIAEADAIDAEHTRQPALAGNPPLGPNVCDSPQLSPEGIMNTQLLIIDREAINEGQTNALLQVRAGGRLQQYGQLNGEITVERGGVLDQHGQVNGDIHCFGRITLRGQVNGDLYAYPDSHFLIAEGVIFGRRVRRYVTADGCFQEVPPRREFITTVGTTLWRLDQNGSLSRA